MPIPFTKMHGLGNDFLMIEIHHLEKVKNAKKFIELAANRRLGIGCDQLILFNQTSSSNYEMQIYNADGSNAKACGNATRCLAYLAYQSTGQKAFLIKVGNRKLTCDILPDAKVRVNMGHASFDEPWMPKQDELWKLSEIYKMNPRDLLCVDVGNPHLVIFGEALSESEMEFLGEKFSTHPIFTNGVNVNFARPENSELHLTVWERGVGMSLACGSGACASFAAASKLGFIGGKTALVHLKLGSLEMQLNNTDVIMTGPAVKVATGELYVEGF